MNQFAMIYMTVEVDRERIDTHPPQVPFEADNDRAQQDLIDNAKRTAYMYDQYKVVMQTSVLWQNRFYHFMFCDDPDLPVRQVNEEWRYIEVVDYEKALIKRVTELMHNICPETPEGVSLGGGILAGWKVNAETWPLLANKAFGYGYTMPRCLLTDPMKRWSTIDRLFELSNIYSQGMSMSMRRLPTLADALDYWGCVGEHAKPDEIRQAICTNPVVAAGKIEEYLRDMETVIRQYYRIESGE
jgi:hypothetical protein